MTRLFKQAASTASFYRVLKNDRPLGALVPENLWRSLVEDLEALSSPTYKARVARARAEKKRLSSSEVKKRLGL